MLYKKVVFMFKDLERNITKFASIFSMDADLWDKISIGD